MGGTITEATLTLNANTHQRVRDIDILLVAPGGQKVIVTVGCGPNERREQHDADLVGLGRFIVGHSGRLFRGPINRRTSEPGDTFAAPAPAGPYGTSFWPAFNGQSANGRWSLYVVDDQVTVDGEYWRRMESDDYDGGRGAPARRRSAIFRINRRP